jgi:hypothetical protein
MRAAVVFGFSGGPFNSLLSLRARRRHPAETGFWPAGGWRAGPPGYCSFIARRSTGARHTSLSAIPHFNVTPGDANGHDSDVDRHAWGYAAGGWPVACRCAGPQTAAPRMYGRACFLPTFLFLPLLLRLLSCGC